MVQSASPVSDKVEGLSPNTVAAFLAVAVLGGGNAVAIRLGNLELAPFWGAAIRFLAAGLLFFGLTAFLRIGLPKGRALTGVALFGLVNFGLGYAFLYWALQEANAGTAQVVLALVPLATFLLAVVQRVEPFRVLGLLGAIIAAAGVVWLFLESAEGVSLAALMALLGSAICFAQAGIVVKKFPPVHPVAENALAMAIGGGVLLVLSLIVGEPRTLPTETSTWLSVIYLVLLGSVALFLLVLFVLHRWTASASAYSLLLMPIMTIVLGVVLLDEPVTPSLLAGAALVVLGVYVGVFVRPARRGRGAAP